jgi:hypothetical protein
MTKTQDVLDLPFANRQCVVVDTVFSVLDHGEGYNPTFGQIRNRYDVHLKNKLAISWLG